MKLAIVSLLLLVCCSAANRMSGPQRMTGLWRNDFEGSQFCPAPAKSCSFVPNDKRSEPLIWFDFAGPLPDKFKIERQGGLYAVDFIGRRTVDRGHYGHMGVFDGEVIVDRMISMKEIETPPKPTKTDIRSMMKQCLAMPGCAKGGKTMKALEEQLKD